MFLFIFGILDFLAGLSVIAAYLGFDKSILLIAFLYLLLKSLIYIKNIVSMVDLIAAVLILLAFFGFINFFTFIVSFWLLQKGVFSLFSIYRI